jgi:hypothetical protein
VQQQIFLEGSDADRFYLIDVGRVALETFAPAIGTITIQTIASGDGCQLSLLNCKDELLAVADELEIANFLQASVPW